MPGRQVINRGIDLRMDTDVASVEREGDSYRVNLKRGDSIATDLVMAATGRSAAVVTAGLAALGLDPAARPERLGPEIFVRLLRWSVGL